MENNGLPVLWQLAFSHFNEKARWALDYKGIAHRRRSALPGLHAIRAIRLYGGRAFPVLVLDGEAIGGSDRIIDALEQRWPEPPLYPEHAIQRDLALELQGYFDAELGPHLRRFIFFWGLRDAGESSAFMSQGFPLAARAAYRAAFPVTRIGLRRVMSIDAQGAALARKKMLASLDRIESELGSSGYLVGNDFSVADLAGAALWFPIVRPPGMQCEVPQRWPDEVEEFRDSISERTGFKWVEEIWRKHRGTSCEVPDRGIFTAA